MAEPKTDNNNTKISPELDLSLNADMSGDDGDFPNVPKRETLNSPPNHIFGVKPPVVHRDSKPLSPKMSPKKKSVDGGGSGTRRQLSLVKL